MSVARPGANSLGDEPRASRNPLLKYLIGSLWKLKRLRKHEFNGKLCRVVNVKGTVAKVTLVGDMTCTRYRVNCSQLVHPSDYEWKPSETDAQFYARVRAQKEFDRLARVYEIGHIIATAAGSNQGNAMITARVP